MKANEHIEEEKWALLAKSLFDKEADAEGLASNLSQDELPAAVKDPKEIEQLAKKLELYHELKKYPTGPAWEKIQGRIHPTSTQKQPIIKRLIQQPLLRIAASLLMAALLTVAGYELYTHWGAQGRMMEISASSASIQSFTLPDGTLVSLNSNTHLTYPQQFGNKTREVTIEGEAFFEVTPNPAKPFIIHAGAAQVKVLGTSFNVNAYPKAKVMEVIVETGKVQVFNPKTDMGQNHELILIPGEKGTLVHESNALLKSTNENPNFIAWKTHDLIFRATSLSEVIANLENVYKVTIRLENPELGGQLLTAHFNNYPLDFILKVIETTFRMETQLENGKYILKAKS